MTEYRRMKDIFADLMEVLEDHPELEMPTGVDEAIKLIEKYRS